MTPDEIDMLYTYVQIGDNRRDSDPLILQQWASVLRNCRHLHIALEAVNRHRTLNPGTWLEPGHIAASYRAIAARVLAHHHDPAGDPDDVAAYLHQIEQSRQSFLADPRNLPLADRTPDIRPALDADRFMHQLEARTNERIHP